MRGCTDDFLIIVVLLEGEAGSVPETVCCWFPRSESVLSCCLIFCEMRGASLTAVVFYDITLIGL